MLSGLAEIMKESRESLAEMQRNHDKAAADQAQAAPELSLKAIQAVSASNAKIAVQPATLNCGANGLTGAVILSFASKSDDANSSITEPALQALGAANLQA